MNWLMFMKMKYNNILLYTTTTTPPTTGKLIIDYKDYQNLKMNI